MNNTVAWTLVAAYFGLLGFLTSIGWHTSRLIVYPVIVIAASAGIYRILRIADLEEKGEEVAWE
ncbi:MAG: hypothetical protein ACM3WT_07695 [Bacillota bacterium]